MSDGSSYFFKADGETTWETPPEVRPLSLPGVAGGPPPPCPIADPCQPRSTMQPPLPPPPVHSTECSAPPLLSNCQAPHALSPSSTRTPLPPPSPQVLRVRAPKKMPKLLRNQSRVRPSSSHSLSSMCVCCCREGGSTLCHVDTTQFPAHIHLCRCTHLARPSFESRLPERLARRPKKPGFS